MLRVTNVDSWASSSFQAVLIGAKSKSSNIQVAQSSKVDQATTK